MKKYFMITLTAICLALGLTLIVSTDSMAVHKGAGDLTCGQCHTMHSSQGGTNSLAMGGTTGSFILLRENVSSRSMIHNLCLQCHSQGGSQGNDPMPPHQKRAPKVHLTTSAPDSATITFTNVGAGGDFSGECGLSNPPFTDTSCGTSAQDALGRGHSLGRTSVVPPGNSTTGTTGSGNTLEEFTCTSCHDPHGTSTTTSGINKFRNLKASNYIPSGALNAYDWSLFLPVNAAYSYVGGINGKFADGGNYVGSGTGDTANHIWPVYKDTSNQNAYNSDTAANDLTGAVVGLSRFCAQCHGAWHEPTASTGNNAIGQDWARHPTQAPLTELQYAGSGVDTIDFAHYSTYAGIVEGVNKVPAAHNGVATSIDTYYADNQADRVFCLSCHFAHGSPNYDILRWDYTSAVSAGSQTANSVSSVTGCQQCHNR